MRETMLHLFHYSSTHLKGESLLYSLVIKTINVTMSKEKVSSYLFLLRKCTELDKDYTRNCRKSDPFSILLHNVEKTLREGSDTIVYPEGLDEKSITFVPSTSSEDTSDRITDPRIKYGDIVSSIFCQIASELTLLRSNLLYCDEYTLISIRDISLISCAFQFFILASVTPYLDEGIGIPLHKRSILIKTWKKLTTDINFRKIQLKTACNVIGSLLNCNGAIQSELMRRYLPDIICAHEQFNYLNRNENITDSTYDHLLNMMDPPTLISTFLVLIKHTDSNYSPPSWFNISIGSRLSSRLTSENGLFHTLTAYQEIGGDDFWQNTHFLTRLGKQFALPPRGNKMTYYENISKQFFKLIKGDRFPPDHLFHLFSVFTDEMRRKNELAANVFIMDILFRPWEMILEGSLVNWCSGFTTSLYVLSMWSNSKICPDLILNSTRLLAICPILLDIINSTVQSIGEILDPVNRLHETILSVIRFSVQRIANLSELLLSYIVSESRYVEILCKRQFIQVVGEEENSRFGNISLKYVDIDREELINRRIGAVMTLLKYLDSSNATRLLIEMACASVQLWEKEEVNHEAPRFVNVDEKHSGDPEFRKLSSHLMAEVFFEQLGEWDFDNTDVAVIVSIVKLVEVVLTSVRNSLEAEQNRRKMFDIHEKKNTEFSQMYAIKVQTTKMAVGLAGAIVFAAIIHEEISNALSAMYSEVQNFVSFIESSNYDELSSVASDAKQLILLLQGNELQILNGPSRSSEKKTEPTDFLSELRLDLAHELPAMRGEALLRTSKMIRKRNSLVLSALSSWLFETIKELVSDYDSYVYLAAINALAEAACYDSNHLRDLIDFFKQLGAQSVPCSKNLADTEAVVLQRAKLCEVIGKVFKVLGDVAPFWLNDVAGIFLSCLRESHDIIRASALSALADLLLCCRGKGIDKYLDEILFAVDCILRSDNSYLVRRSAVNLVRQTIRSCDATILMVMGGRLRDLRRSLMHLWKWDTDHVVRLHAQLSIEEIKLALEKTVHCEIEEMYRPATRVGLVLFARCPAISMQQH